MADDRNDLWFFVVSTVLALLLGAASAYLPREVLAAVCLALSCVFLVVLPFIRGKHHWWWVAPTVFACGGAVLLVLEMAEDQKPAHSAASGVSAPASPALPPPQKQVPTSQATAKSVASRRSIREPVAPAKEITYYEREQLTSAADDPLLRGDEAWFDNDPPSQDDKTAPVEADGNYEASMASSTAPIVTSSQSAVATYKPPRGVMDAGVRKAIDGFLIVWGDDDMEQEHTIIVRRDRSEANLEPLRFVLPFKAPDCRYSKISRYHEEALVCYSQIGSGGFLTLHVALWNGHEYVDVAREVPHDRSCAAFSFADFDGDGDKELIITHCRIAYDSATEIYQFNSTNFVYEQLADDDPFYAKSLDAAAEIMNDKPFWGEEGDDTPWKNPELRDPATAKMLQEFYNDKQSPKSRTKKQ